MNAKEELVYLKNLTVVAHADGIVTPEESALLDKFRVAIGAKKSTLTKAIRESPEHTIELTPIIRLSDRLRNIEDMLELCLADSDEHQNERVLILTAAKAAGVHDSVLDQAIKEAESRRASAAPVCTGCGSALPANSRFCMSCGAEVGTALDKKPAEKVELTIPESGITVAFAHSSSASFPNAMDIAKSTQTFQSAKRGGKKWYAATFSPADTKRLIGIAAALHSLRNKEAFVDGSRADWSDVFSFANCAQRREESYDGIHYCFGLEDSHFNVWGCQQIRMDWTGWSDWFKYGKFINATTWEFDLNRIAHELRQACEGLRLCPHIRIRYINAVLNSLPRKVTVGPKSGWSYRECFDADPRAITVRNNRYGYEDTIKAIGVQPDDAKTAAGIIKAAIKKAKEPELTLTKLRLR